MGNKIIFIVRDFKGHGANKTFIDIFNELTEIGEDPIIWVIKENNGNLKPDLSENCKNVLKPVSPFLILRLLLNFKALHYARELYSILRIGGVNTLFRIIGKIITTEPDSTIVCYNSKVLLFLLFAIKITGSRIRVVYQITEAFGPKNWILNPPSEMKNHIIFLVTRLMWMVDEYIAVSSCAARDFSARIDIKKSKMNIVHNPIDCEKIDNLKNKSLSKHVRHPSKPFIIALTRLHPDKDIISLLSAFISLRHKYRDIELLILGEGHERQRLQRFCRKNAIHNSVYMPGWVDNPYYFLNKAMLCILPSKSEGWGNVLVEALACGCPVVSTDCGGPREILDDGKFGLLVPPGDIKKLEEAISLALVNPLPCSTLQARSSCFSKPKIIRSYIDILTGYS